MRSLAIEFCQEHKYLAPLLQNIEPSLGKVLLGQTPPGDHLLEGGQVPEHVAAEDGAVVRLQVRPPGLGLPVEHGGSEIHTLLYFYIN